MIEARCNLLCIFGATFTSFREAHKFKLLFINHIDENK